MLNKVMLIGNVGKDPQMHYSQGGNAVASFSIATVEKWKDKSGAKQEKTEWHNVVIFGKLAEVVSQYVHKGSKLYVEGKLQTDKYTDKEGVERYTTKVIANSMVMLDGKKDDVEQESGGGIDPADPMAGMEDDIPF